MNAEAVVHLSWKAQQNSESWCLFAFLMIPFVLFSLPQPFVLLHLRPNAV